MSQRVFENGANRRNTVVSLGLFFFFFLLLGTRPLPALVITEIMYHPTEAEQWRYEFIEIYNENADPLDLSGYTICNGVNFEFPLGTYLDGRTFLVVCADEASIQSKYGLDASLTIGNWTGRLANEGERIEVCNPGGKTVTEVRFNDRGKWSSGADGTGHTLSLVSPFVEVDDADSWALSEELGGTPGEPNNLGFAVGGGPTAGAYMDSSGFFLRWLVLGPYTGWPSCNSGTATLQDDWLLDTTNNIREIDRDSWEDGVVVRTNYGEAASTGLHPNAGVAVPTIEDYASASDTINFNDVVYPPDPNNTMAYAFIYVDNVTGSSLAVDIACASDDAISILLNNASGSNYVHVNDACRAVGGAGEIQDRAPATLRPGKNLFAVKVYENGGGWAFRFRLERRGTGIPITSNAMIQLTTDPNAGLGFDGSGEPIEDPDEPPPPPPDPGESAGAAPVVINEGYFLTNDERWIELYNRTGDTFDLSGFYLTDDRNDLVKTRLADGTEIPAGGYLSLTETELGLDFSVLVDGGRVFVALVEPTGDRVTDAYLFEPHFAEMSEARVPDGDSEFADAADPTRSAANVLSVNQDIVINEVMFHPIDDDLEKEYIEFYNRGAAAVNMTDWELTRGVNFVFPPGTTLAAGGYLVVARNPELIRQIYGLTAAEVIGPETPEALENFGQLLDRGERITLKDELGRTVDTLRYYDGGEFPRWADGHGSSMELVDPWQDNRFGQAWDASDDSEKAVTEEFSYFGRHGGGESELHLLLLSRGITVVDDVQVLGGGVQVSDTPFIEDDETWRYFKGREAPPANWNELGFNDGSWLSGQTGIGYGDGDDVTVLDDMGGAEGYLTIFCRKTFNIANQEVIDDIQEFVLSIIVDDGFYAYLNGVEVASFNVSSPAWDASAGSAVPDGDLVERDISSFKNLLRVGTNVLAVQVHNTGLTSSDLTFIPRLVDRTTIIAGGVNQVVNGTFDSNDSGWIIQGTHVRSGRTTTDSIGGAGSLKIISAGRGDNKVNRIETSNSGLGTLNTNEDLMISFKARWIVGSPTILSHGYQHAMAKSHVMSVPEDLGTPGRQNSVSSRLIAATGDWNLGPVITDVRQSPAVPGDDEDVVVTARVDDADGVSSVRLRYSLNNPAASPSTVNMSHAGGGIYRATIPGRPLGTKIVFFITATDSVGAPGRFPIDITTRTHPLLLNPPSAALDDHRYLIYRHDQRDPGTNFHSYRFWMTDADQSYLDTRPNLSNDQISGSFVYGSDTIYYESHTRFGGSPFARGKWGSFRVAMPRDNELHGRIRKFGMDMHHGNGLNANERVSYYLMRLNQGSDFLPYSEILTMVRWQVNSRVTSILEQLWVPDAQFISFWFPGDDDGDFLEMDDRFVISDSGGRDGNTDGRVLYPPPSPRGDGDGTNKENYRWFFTLRAKNGLDDYTNFVEFCRVMDPGSTSNVAFDQQIWDVCNVEEFLRMWAVRLNTADWDQWSANRGKNCYFYRPEIDGRWHLIAYDMELTYGNLDSYLIPASPGSAYNPGGFAEVNRMFNRPKIKRMWYAILNEMVNGSGRWFHSSRLSTYMDKLAALGMSNTGHGQPGGYIDQRYDRLAPRVRPAVFPQVRLEITTNGGSDFVTDQFSVALAGRAPADACVLIVSNNAAPGESYPTNFTSMTNWTMSDVQVVPGANELTVIGLDLQGNVVDSDSISVTSTAEPLDPPVITTVKPSAGLAGDDVEILGSEFISGVRVFFGDTESPSVSFRVAEPGRIVAEVPAGAGTVMVTVRNIDGQTSNEVSFNYLSTFVRGDANGDGVLSLSDAVKILVHLFNGVAIDCADAADADDNEEVNITDAMQVLNHLFRGGVSPGAPYPDAGPDPAGDALDCER